MAIKAANEDTIIPCIRLDRLFRVAGAPSSCVSLLSVPGSGSFSGVSATCVRLESMGQAVAGRSGDGSLRDFLSEFSFGSWGYVVNDWLPAALDGRSERPTGGCGIARLGKRAGEDFTFRPAVVTYCSPSERRAVSLRCALHLPWLA